MKQNILDYSFEMRQERNRKTFTVVVLLLSVIFFLLILFNFLLFPVHVKSDSMYTEIPRGSAVFVTPIKGNPSRGDVVYVSSSDSVQQSFGKKLLVSIIRLVTAQKYDPFTYSQNVTDNSCLRRVLAVPGDTVYMKDYVLYVKTAGSSSFLTEYEVIPEDYQLNIFSVPAQWDGIGLSGDMDQLKLGENEYFLLSDNRIEALDSRVWGKINISRIKGKALLVYFPFNAFKGL